MKDSNDQDFGEDSPYRAVIRAQYYRCSICHEELSGRVKILGHVAFHIDCLGRLEEAKQWPTFRVPVRLQLEVRAESRADAVEAINGRLGAGVFFGSLAEPEINVLSIEMEREGGDG